MGPRKDRVKIGGISVQNQFLATNSGYFLTSARHMTSGRALEAHRTLDALSSSMALRYDGSNVGVVLLLHCFYAASFPSHGRKPGVQCTVVVAHRLTHPGIDEEGPHEPTRRHWEMAMGKISAFTLPSCAASFTCSLFTCRPPLPLGLHWACTGPAAPTAGFIR